MGLTMPSDVALFVELYFVPWIPYIGGGVMALSIATLFLALFKELLP